MHAAKEKASVPAQDGLAVATAEQDGAAVAAAKLVTEDRPGTVPSPEWIKLRALALRHLDRFMALEPKVLQGEDPEAIHDMRVASRRLQQVLDLAYPPPGLREVRRLRRRIQRCRKALGEVRNCDVLLQRCEKALTSKRNSRRAIWELASDYLQERRSNSFGKALRKLAKANLASLYVGLKERLALNGVELKRADSDEEFPESQVLDAPEFYTRVGHSMESAWNEFAEKVAETFRPAAHSLRAAGRQPQASALHGVRIAAKRLRYLVEIIEEFDVPGSREPIVWLRGLQKHLGDWHDLEVMERMLTEMVARPRFIRNHLEMTLDVLRLLRSNRRVKKTFGDKYLQATRHSADYEHTKQWATHLISSPDAVFPPPA